MSKLNVIAVKEQMDLICAGVLTVCAVLTAVVG